MNAVDFQFFLSRRPEENVKEIPSANRSISDADLGDFAGEQFAPEPPEPRPSVEIFARNFVQHPTFDNFKALRMVIGGSR